MSRIAGVFNNKRSVELVLKSLEVQSSKEADLFWLCTENGEFYSHDLQDLSQKEDNGSRNCMGFCFANSARSRKGIESKFVADAELYNVNELKGEYDIEGENSYDVLLRLVEKPDSFACLTKIEGAYAFAYWIADELYIARDLFGLKAVYFAHSDGFAFASERKALEAMGFYHAIGLEPRTLLRYELKEDRLCFEKRVFFSIVPELKADEVELKEKVLNLLRASIRRLIPVDERFGVLFSGGLDSTLIAYLCKELDADFVCYTVAVEEPGMKAAEDLGYARQIAADLSLKQKTIKLRADALEKPLQEVVSWIDDTDVVKVSVALPLYVACEHARADGIKTVLYGLGTEELFAGYRRHKHVKPNELNAECLSGIWWLYESDLYRDEQVARAQGISLRAPFLAMELVDYALKIPAAYKLAGNENRVILRAIARDLGLVAVASRKKRAVQYGSNYLKAIDKIARREGYRYKREYLKTLYPSRNVKLGCLFSSGKDSSYALWHMKQVGYPVACLITLKSLNQESYMFHTPAIDLAKLQAEAIGLPILMKETEGKKEEELADLRDALSEAKRIYGIEGVITGALWSNYQKERIERIAAEEDIKVFSPLWHMNQETEMRLVVSYFDVILSGISAYGLDKSWLGRKITVADVDRLVARNKYLLNIAGEGGEFESLVLDGPMFQKRLVIQESEIVEEDENTARLVVKAAKLLDKSQIILE
ncbi:asparagine synthase (glutamine-hydrolysing) [Methanophagales archaeon]|nr:asparagine synthase (glutamine-hydrolysing) [Methanophagales archaeon]